MKILIDECFDVKLKRTLSAQGFDCYTVREMGLASKRNGELLDRANRKFDVLLTIDKSIRYQQKYDRTENRHSGHSSKFADILTHIPAAVAALQSISPGQVIYIGEGV